MDNYILGLLIANLLGVAFAFGKLWQKTSDIDNRLERLENIQNSKDSDARRTLEQS